MKPVQDIGWKIVLECFRGACVYCAAPATTKDHVKPRSQRGPQAWWNLVPACKHCNNTRGDVPIHIFVAAKHPDKRDAVLARFALAVILLREWHTAAKYTDGQRVQMEGVFLRNVYAIDRYRDLYNEVTRAVRAEPEPMAALLRAQDESRKRRRPPEPPKPRKPAQERFGSAGYVARKFIDAYDELERFMPPPR